MIVVSNTSPLANLAVVEGLPLLQQLYGTIHIPVAVQQELASGALSLPILGKVLHQDWIRIEPVRPTPLLAALEAQLDPGEAEAIALASERGAGRLLLDERKARKVAQRMSLPVLGLLGCLVLAKQQGLIQEVRPWIESLRDKAGFRVSEEPVRAVLTRTGE